MGAVLFVLLFGAFVAATPGWDATAKWALCVLVMVVVDLAWLALGVLLGRVRLGAKGQRAMNLAMGGAIRRRRRGWRWRGRGRKAKSSPGGGGGRRLEGEERAIRLLPPPSSLRADTSPVRGRI